MYSVESLPGEILECGVCGCSVFSTVSESLEMLAMECVRCHGVYKWDWVDHLMGMERAGCGEVCRHGSYASLCPLCSGVG